MTKQQELENLKTNVELFSINLDDPTIDEIKNKIADIKSSIHHEDKAKLIETLTKNNGEGKNFFHHLFKSYVALDKKHQVMEECRNISMNGIYLAKLADKFDRDVMFPLGRDVMFPLDYAMKKAQDKIFYVKVEKNLWAGLGDLPDRAKSMLDIIKEEVITFMRKDKFDGFDNHAQPAVIKYNTETRFGYGERSFELASDKATIISYAFANDGTRLAEWRDSKTSVEYKDFIDKRNDQHKPPNHFKSNDPINLISIKVALIDKETLSNKTSEDYTKYTLPRLKDIKTLKDSVPERYGEFESAKCFNDWSINEFIKQNFSPINNIDGLINLLPEEDVELGGGAPAASE